MDVADACHERGIKAVAVTAGYVCDEPRRELFGHMDAANVDLKGFTEEFYKRVCVGHLAAGARHAGVPRARDVVWVEVTTLLIPGQNDGDDELHRMTEWFAEHLGTDVPLHFTAFHPDFKMTDLPPHASGDVARVHATSRCRRACATSTQATSTTEPAARTYCTRCDTVVIERDWYELGSYRLDDVGCCTACGTPLAGVFDGPPESWGRRRQPVALNRDRR